MKIKRLAWVAISIGLVIIALCLGLALRKDSNAAGSAGLSANNATPSPVSLRGSNDNTSKGTLGTEAQITSEGGVETVTPEPTTTPFPTNFSAVAGIDPVTGELICVSGTKGVYSGFYEADPPNLDPYTVSVCCPASCETCVGIPTENAKLGEGYCGLGVENECCAVLSATVLLDTLPACISSDQTPCILERPGICEDRNPCMNGSKCSLGYFTEYSVVRKTLAVCECGPGYTGEKCETKCGVDEQPCGAWLGGYTSGYFSVDTTCCGSDAECVKVGSKYNWSSVCLLKDRPQPDCVKDNIPLCMNGGTCAYGVHSISDYLPLIPYCDCPPLFGGALCEIQIPDITCTSINQDCFIRPPNKYLGQSTSPDYCCADTQMCACGMTTCGCIDTPAQA